MKLYIMIDLFQAVDLWTESVSSRGRKLNKAFFYTVLQKFDAETFFDEEKANIYSN